MVKRILALLGVLFPLYCTAATYNAGIESVGFQNTAVTAGTGVSAGPGATMRNLGAPGVFRLRLEVFKSGSSTPVFSTEQQTPVEIATNHTYSFTAIWAPAEAAEYRVRATVLSPGGDVFAGNSSYTNPRTGAWVMFNAQSYNAGIESVGFQNTAVTAGTGVSAGPGATMRNLGAPGVFRLRLEVFKSGSSTPVFSTEQQTPVEIATNHTYSFTAIWAPAEAAEYRVRATVLSPGGDVFAGNSSYTNPRTGAWVTFNAQSYNAGVVSSVLSDTLLTVGELTRSYAVVRNLGATGLFRVELGVYDADSDELITYTQFYPPELAPQQEYTTPSFSWQVPRPGRYYLRSEVTDIGQNAPFSGDASYPNPKLSNVMTAISTGVSYDDEVVIRYKGQDVKLGVKLAEVQAVERGDRFLDFNLGTGQGALQSIHYESELPLTANEIARLAWLAWKDEPPAVHLLNLQDFGYHMLPFDQTEWPIPNTVYQSQSSFNALLEQLDDPVEREAMYYQILFEAVTMQDYVGRFGKRWHGSSYKHNIYQALQQIYPQLSEQKIEDLLNQLFTDIQQNTLPSRPNVFTGATELLQVASFLVPSADLADLSNLTNLVLSLKSMGEADQQKQFLLESLAGVLMQASVSLQFVQFLEQQIAPRSTDPALHLAIANLRDTITAPDAYAKKLASWVSNVDSFRNGILSTYGFASSLAQAKYAHMLYVAAAKGSPALAKSVALLGAKLAIPGALIYAGFEIYQSAGYYSSVAGTAADYELVMSAKLALLFQSARQLSVTETSYTQYRMADLLFYSVQYRDVNSMIYRLLDQPGLSGWAASLLPNQVVDSYLQWAWGTTGDNGNGGKLSDYAQQMFKSYPAEEWVVTLLPYVDVPDPAVTYPLTVEFTAAAGFVRSVPVGITCGESCQMRYSQNTVVTLYAEDRADAIFQSWGGACAFAGQQRQCQVQMDQAQQVTVNYAAPAQRFDLAIQVAGVAGKVASYQFNESCLTECHVEMPEQTYVSLFAYELDGSNFTGWSGACSGAQPYCTVLMDADKSVVANFAFTEPRPPVLLPASDITSEGATLNWYPDERAEGYLLDVSTTADFSQRLPSFADLDVGKVINYRLNELDGGQTFYFRLRAYNTQGLSDYSAIQALILPLSPPGVISADTIMPDGFVLTWQAVLMAEGYLVDIFTDAELTQPVPGYHNRDAGNVVQFQVSGLESETMYFIRVRAYNAAHVSDYPLGTVVIVTLSMPQPIDPRYVINSDGTVTDSSTDLVWMRCSIGQQWYDGSCVGESAILSATQAQDLAQSFSFANASDWRLPTIEELQSLVFCSSQLPAYWKDNADACEGDYEQPTIDAVAFPNQPGYFWSATVSSAEPFYHRWFVNFFDGDTRSAYEGNGMRARFVRNSQVAMIGAPDALPATNITADRFTANWSSVEGATGYRLDVAWNADFSEMVMGYHNLDVGNTTAYVVKELNSQWPYYYRVRAYNASQISGSSPEYIQVITAAKKRERRRNILFLILPAIEKN